LIGSIDLPDAGSQPVGPSRTVIALGGLVGGLVTGLGVVFLACRKKNAKNRPRRISIDRRDFHSLKTVIQLPMVPAATAVRR